MNELTGEEERERGTVSKEVYFNYYRYIGGTLIFTFLFFLSTLWMGL